MKEAQVILNRLLDKFENSKHLSEPNTSRRRVMLRIDKRELPEYQYEDAVVRDAYNIAARELEQQALVRLEWARKQSVLSCIVLDLERVAQCYECADRVHPQKKAEEEKKKQEASSSKSFEIVDTSLNVSGFNCPQALEEIYKDSKYTYSLPCTKSSYIVVKYSDGSVENIKTALNNGNIKITDLKKFNIQYYTDEN